MDKSEFGIKINRLRRTICSKKNNNFLRIYFRVQNYQNLFARKYRFPFHCKCREHRIVQGWVSPVTSWVTLGTVRCMIPKRIEDDNCKFLQQWKCIWLNCSRAGCRVYIFCVFVRVRNLRPIVFSGKSPFFHFLSGGARCPVLIDNCCDLFTS
jgi:hypothetical protein